MANLRNKFKYRKYFDQSILLVDISIDETIFATVSFVCDDNIYRAFHVYVTEYSEYLGDSVSAMDYLILAQLYLRSVGLKTRRKLNSAHVYYVAKDKTEYLNDD